MFEEDHSTETTLRDRLRSIDSESDAGNGTLLADATATLLAADAAAAGANAATIEALTDQELDSAMDAVGELLAVPDRVGVDLPFGTRATSHDAGSAIVADREFVLVARHSGMTPVDLAPMVFEGPNLDDLLRLIDHRAKCLACRALGLPAPMTQVGRFDEHWLRFAPCEEAGGVSLEINLGGRPIAWTTHARLIEIADGVVQAMSTFWRQRRRVAIRAAIADEQFSTLAANADPDARGLAIAGLAAHPTRTPAGEEVPLCLLVTTFDEAFRPSEMRWTLHEPDDVPRILAQIRRHHASCLRSIAAGEPPEIDELAAAIAEAAPEGTAAVLARLAASAATDVLLPVPDRRPLVARLYWTHGIVVADLYADGRLEHSTNCLGILDANIPETVAVSMVGRPLGEVVDLPFACPFPILGAEHRGRRRLHLRFHTELRPVDLAAGTIGAAVASGAAALAA